MKVTQVETVGAYRVQLIRSIAFASFLMTGNEVEAAM